LYAKIKKMKNLLIITIFLAGLTFGCGERETTTSIEAQEQRNDTIAFTPEVSDEEFTAGELSELDGTTETSAGDTIRNQQSAEKPKANVEEKKTTTTGEKKSTDNVEKETPTKADTTAKIPQTEKQTTEAPKETTLTLTAGNTGNRIKVSGTSSLHDWSMESLSFTAKSVVKVNNSSELISIESFTFSLPVHNLKSKDEKMDKNARDALKADRFRTMDFNLTRANITPTGNNRYSIKATGNLTIAGTTREFTLDATGILNENRTFTVTGSRAFNMTEFNVKPPELLLGTIKTGDRITVEYQVTLQP
jgi:polyisoprenoid-binding protein YceI